MLSEFIKVIVIILTTGSLSSHLLAAVMDDKDQLGVGVYIGDLEVKKSDDTSRDHFATSIFLQKKLLPFSFVDAEFMWAGRDENITSSVKNRLDLLVFGAGVGVYYNLLFRYSLSLKPLLIWHNNDLQLKGDSGSQNKRFDRFQLGFKGDFVLDYKINDRFLLGYAISMFHRQIDDKTDLGYSWKLTYTMN